MKVNLNSFCGMSTMDYPGKAACVVFLNGCPFRCPGCHNKQTWEGKNDISINKVIDMIKDAKLFISTVVFSGGEPTQQIKSLIRLCYASKAMGLSVGIETNGFFPERMEMLKPYVDKYFLDIKAPISDQKAYFKATKNSAAWYKINHSINLDLPIEIRVVDTGKTKEIIASLRTKYKVTILPFIKR